MYHIVPSTYCACTQTILYQRCGLRTAKCRGPISISCIFPVTSILYQYRIAPYCTVLQPQVMLTPISISCIFPVTSILYQYRIAPYCTVLHHIAASSYAHTNQHILHSPCDQHFVHNAIRPSSSANIMPIFVANKCHRHSIATTPNFQNENTFMRFGLKYLKIFCIEVSESTPGKII